VSFRVFDNGGNGGPIDYSTPVATVAGVTSWTTPFSLTPGTWRIGVRSYDGFGDSGFGYGPWGGLGSGFGEAGFGCSGFGSGEGQNLDCAVTIVIDADGNDVTNLPLPPVGLRAFALAGGSIRVEWWYPPWLEPVPSSRWPTAFSVYLCAVGFGESGFGRGGFGGGPADYSSAAATVPYSSGVAGTFFAEVSGLADGTTYAVGVRAVNASGTESNTSVVRVMARSVGPAAVDSLVAVAVV
jgi:hypothetical protein